MGLSDGLRNIAEGYAEALGSISANHLREAADALNVIEVLVVEYMDNNIGDCPWCRSDAGDDHDPECRISQWLTRLR